MLGKPPTVLPSSFRIVMRVVFSLNLVTVANHYLRVYKLRDASATAETRSFLAQDDEQAAVAAIDEPVSCRGL